MTETEVAIGRFLDSTLVTGAGETRPSEPDDRWEKWVSFSQRGDESYVTLSDGPSGALFSQSEVRSLLACKSAPWLGLITKGASLDC